MLSIQPRYKLYCGISALVKILFCCYVAKFSPFTLPLATESILLMSILICSHFFALKIFIIINIVINACQLASIHSTGECLVSLTIFNINQFNAIGNHIFTIIFIIFGYILLYFVDLIISRKILYTNNWKNILLICIQFFTILYCEINFHTFPVHNFVNTVFNIIKI